MSVHDAFLEKFSGKLQNGVSGNKAPRSEGRGKLICFYTPYKSCRGVTTAMAAVGSRLGMEKDKLVALTEIPGMEYGISELFDNHVTRRLNPDNGGKTGLAALFLSFKGSRLDREKIRSCGKKTVFNNMDLFPADTGLGDEEGRLEKTAAKALILNSLTYAYDYVLLDSGHEEDYLQEADVVVCLIPQNIKLLKNQVREMTVESGKLVFLINSYFKKSSNSSRAIAFLYGWKTYVLPFNQNYMDAVADGAVGEFFGRNCIGFSEREFYKKLDVLCERIKGET